MTRLIDANKLWLEMASETAGYCYPCDMVWKAIENTPTIDAIPIKWLTAQAENPSNSDKLRNAIDYIVYTLWAEREEE